MGADKGKKQKVDEENNTIDGELVFSIEKLQEIQDELEKINEEASDKVLEVEQKYNEIRKPVYDKRNDIIKAIPDFWLTAFLSHPVLGELLAEEDQKIFKFLSSIEVEDSKDVKSGYSITFNFNANPYFENTKLSKTYTFLEDGPTKISATTIKWKEGMGIPNGVAHEKKGNKRSHAEESFFTWFSEVNQKDEDEDEALEIQDEVADIIKDDLWPNPLTYFNNEPDEEDFDGDEGKDSEGSEDEEEEEEEDEDGDEE
ncbi:NAP1-related protein 2 [Nicotiana tabacum]|uniref:NAP1-related protein 2 n=1 Tax=Nicotiana tabacum TaxID=4097 RepID=A0A1S3XYS0_TOBAC|nr:NAP1-related protein 2-like [Nicotiana tomentosiformis]XP_016444989.1 PREDICTED: NAP1-related protein 2-like [Nicotiana tabacum]